MEILLLKHEKLEINRFYDLQVGKILYDGIGITTIKKADWRRSTAIVLQDTPLFTGTIMENIRYGNLMPVSKKYKQQGSWLVPLLYLAKKVFIINCIPVL